MHICLNTNQYISVNDFISIFHNERNCCFRKCRNRFICFLQFHICKNFSIKNLLINDTSSFRIRRLLSTCQLISFFCELCNLLIFPSKNFISLILLFSKLFDVSGETLDSLVIFASTLALFQYCLTETICTLYLLLIFIIRNILIKITKDRRIRSIQRFINCSLTIINCIKIHLSEICDHILFQLRSVLNSRIHRFLICFLRSGCKTLSGTKLFPSLFHKLQSLINNLDISTILLHECFWIRDRHVIKTNSKFLIRFISLILFILSLIPIQILCILCLQFLQLRL